MPKKTLSAVKKKVATRDARKKGDKVIPSKGEGSMKKW